MTRRRTMLTLLMACLLATIGPAAAKADRTAAPQAIKKIKIIDFAFQPASVSVPRGSLVGWKNFGAVSHTSTSDDGRWDSGTLAPGEIFGRRFRTAGTFPYHCSIHPQMAGTITVT